MPAEYDGRNVQHYLRGVAGCSCALIRSLKRYENGIMLNDVHVRTIDLIHTGDIISISLQDQPQDLPACDRHVDVLYEDDDVIVYNKPADMPCHPSRAHIGGTLANVFTAHCQRQGVLRTCRILNRLDKDTSGAVLIAKNAFAAATLTGHVQKQYIAVVGGCPQPESGMVDIPVERPDPLDPHREAVSEGRRALTGYRTVAKCTGYSVVECILHTGRTHQIRVHMKYLGCALLGDALYGGNLSQISRQALHCRFLEFVHPVSKLPLRIEAPFFDDMQALIP